MEPVNEQLDFDVEQKTWLINVQDERKAFMEDILRQPPVKTRGAGVTRPRANKEDRREKRKAQRKARARSRA